MTGIRTFNGKRYGLHDWFFWKSDATAKAKKMRKRGWNVRIVKGRLKTAYISGKRRNKWMLYARPKRR